jgi:putative addiction module killer protein
MVEVRQTKEFSTWLHRLKDASAAARIVSRIRVGKGVLEMRIDYGPGYRVYYLHRGSQIVVLLCGGDKRTQDKDIERAHTLAETL